MKITYDTGIDHLTAADRKIIKTMIENKWTWAQSKLTTYKLSPLETPNDYYFFIERNERDCIGAPLKMTRHRKKIKVIL
jgi:hypothetical protein